MTDNDETSGALAYRMLRSMERITHDRIGDLALNNARRNQAVLDQGQSIADLRALDIGKPRRAVIIAAGPSIKRHDPIRLLVEKGFDGWVIATESAVAYCLRHGVVPDLVVTLDPHATRIVRWFGDPSLSESELAKDDYYRRQDMDETFANELAVNEEVLSLVDRHAKDMRVALSTSASQAVVDRVLQTGMQVYWWNPMLDDPHENPDGPTRQLYELNGLPLVNAGGNVGAACWMIAQAVLQCDPIALTGMDFSYYDDTPYAQTQYYPEALAMVGEDELSSLYPRIFNPFLKAWFYTDPAYLWYRECFLDMAADAACRTVNCTGGGILFGDDVEFLSLEDFLADIK